MVPLRLAAVVGVRVTATTRSRMPRMCTTLTATATLTGSHLGPLANLPVSPFNANVKVKVWQQCFSTESDAMRQKFHGLPHLPTFKTVDEERRHVKQRLAGALRLFAKLGYDEGVAGHITARDPEHRDTFWVNGFGVHFSQITASNLIRVNDKGTVIEGAYPVNTAAFMIHSKIHQMRPDVNSAVHSHSIYGRTWSILGRPLDPLTQDACAFYNDHALYNDYGGVAVESDEGTRIATALGNCKAAILQNHGLLTVGETVDSAVWWYIAMERCCQVQLMAESTLNGPSHLAGGLKHIKAKEAEQARNIVGSPFAGWFQFQPLYEKIKSEDPSFLQ